MAEEEYRLRLERERLENQKKEREEKERLRRMKENEDKFRQEERADYSNKHLSNVNRKDKVYND
jgi:hypothetical protein